MAVAVQIVSLCLQRLWNPCRWNLCRHPNTAELNRNRFVVLRASKSDIWKKKKKTVRAGTVFKRVKTKNLHSYASRWLNENIWLFFFCVCFLELWKWSCQRLNTFKASQVNFKTWWDQQNILQLNHNFKLINITLVVYGRTSCPIYYLAAVAT